MVNGKLIASVAEERFVKKVPDELSKNSINCLKFSGIKFNDLNTIAIVSKKVNGTKF